MQPNRYKRRSTWTHPHPDWPCTVCGKPRGTDAPKHGGKCRACYNTGQREYMRQKHPGGYKAPSLAWAPLDLEPEPLGYCKYWDKDDMPPEEQRELLRKIAKSQYYKSATNGAEITKAVLRA